MLDAFKKGASTRQQQADELQSLIAASKEERAALSTMLTQVQLQSAKLASASKSLQEVEEKADKAHTRLDEVNDSLRKAASRAGELETIDARIKALADAVAQAEQESTRLTAPDGELARHRHALEDLSQQTLATRASLDALRNEQSTLDGLRGELVHAQAEIKASADRAGGLQSDLEELRSASGLLTGDFNSLKELSRQTHDEVHATLDMVNDVEKRLEPLAALQDMCKTIEERMATLNGLSEHVGQKIKSLENQKHTVEHAVVEASRLNEMVWAMEEQINKLSEGARQATRTEEMIDRIDKLAHEVGGQLDAGMKARDAFAADLARLESDRASLSDFVRTHTDRLAIERKEFAAFEQRVGVLQGTVSEAEKRMEALADRDRLASAMTQRVDELGGQVEALAADTDELQQKQAALEGLRESLARVDELASRTSRQYDALKQSRQDLEGLRADIQDFYKSHAAAVQLRDRLGADTASLEAFLNRAASFTAGLPELDARLNAITGKLAIVDEATEKAANLVSIADDLDRQMSRIASQQQFVERVESRLHTLNALTGEVDRRLEEQLLRRAEVEALKSQVDGVAIAVGHAQQKLEAVGALEKQLLPLTTQLSAIKSQIDKVHARVDAVQQEEATLAGQERRLSEMLASSQARAEEAAARERAVQLLAQEVSRSSAIKDELVAELSRVQGRQREVSTHLEAAAEQLARIEASSNALEQRRSQLAQSEKRIAAFEARAGELAQLTQELDAKIADIAKRGTLVDAVRQELAAVNEISARSKSDLLHVEDHRNDVAQLRERVDQLLACIDQTESRLGEIEARKKLVDEVQLKTTVISNMLEDVHLNLETLGEQKAVVDHVMDATARLTERTREAQTMLRSLQTERELAERIERSIKQLRKTATKDEKGRRA